MNTGYLNAEYAHSLAEFGRPIELPQSQGWLLERPIQGTDRHDVMGCYPLFCCRNWGKLNEDLQAISSNYVTATLVPDPFNPLSAAELQGCFDQVIPFKTHYVIDLLNFEENTPDRHHRYYARKSLESMTVRRIDYPTSFVDDWVRLYAELVKRHEVRGIRAFSRESFARQLAIPGLRMFVAEIEDRIVAAQLWFVQGEVAYSHLTAISQEGYACRASYGLYWGAIQALQNDSSVKLRWLDLGAGAGLNDESGGLSKFKKGWANDTRTKFLCTRVFNHDSYRQLLHLTGAENEKAYFPAYRVNEPV
jgi:hypothetical protein